jgi:hypothetical protein
MASPVAPTESAPPTSTPGPVGSPPKGGLSGAAAGAIAVVVVAVVVLGVIAAGLVPGVHFPGASKSSSPSTFESSGQALSVANGSANASGRGSLVMILGISTLTPFQYGAHIGNLSCPIVDGLGRNLTIPAETGNYSSGALYGWLFVYYSTSTGWATWIAEFGGHAYYFGYFASGACSDSLAKFSPLPTRYISSVTAAADAGSVTSAFVTAHAEASAEYALLPSNFSGGIPVWHLDYTTCGVGPNSGTGSGDSLNVYLNAADGAILADTSSSGAACSASLAPAPPPFAPVLGAGATLHSYGTVDAGAFAYTVLDLAPSAGLATGEFELEITNRSTGATLPSDAVPATCAVGDDALLGSGACTAPAAGSWYAFLNNSTGKIVATFGGEDGSWSGNVTLLDTDTIEIVTVSQIAVWFELSTYAIGPPIVDQTTPL